MPAGVAARPTDARGYPALAITPWRDGVPAFAATGTARTYICAVERRCSVCGLTMAPGPVWRVVAAAEAEAIAAARQADVPYVNRAATAEPPGHRACMLFAAMVCPYLARPNARRGASASAAEGFTAARGSARGVDGAVAGFAQYEHRYAEIVAFRFSGLVEALPHRLGAEHRDALAAELARGGAEPAERCPDYLLADEDAAERRFRELLVSRL